MEEFLGLLYGHLEFVRFEENGSYVSYIAKVRATTGTQIAGVWVPKTHAQTPSGTLDSLMWAAFFTRKVYRQDPDLPLAKLGRVPASSRVPMWISVGADKRGRSYEAEGGWTMKLTFNERHHDYHRSINLVAALETNSATIRGP